MEISDQTSDEDDEKYTEEEYLDERLSVQYGSTEYWKNRYINEASDGIQSEWVLGFTELRPFLEPLLKNESKILILGCGNSSFSSDLYDAGYHQITNIDSVDVLINDMKQKNLSRDHMKWITRDATDLVGIESDCFDVVIDKTLLDCLMCCENFEELTQKMLCEVQRVLKKRRILCLHIVE